MKSNFEVFAADCKIIHTEENYSEMKASARNTDSSGSQNTNLERLQRYSDEETPSDSSDTEMRTDMPKDNACVLFSISSNDREGKLIKNKQSLRSSSPLPHATSNEKRLENGGRCFLSENSTLVEDLSSDDVKLDGSAGISDFSPILSCSEVSRESGMPQIEPIDSIPNIIPNNTDNYAGVRAPLLGYEVLEQRSRCTVYTINVQLNKTQSWFIFRRYNEFLRLNVQLKSLFPHILFVLPPKKWFGDNFDRDFLRTRMSGLQAFINSVIGHQEARMSSPVRQFLCLDEPIEPFDTLEGCRALCESLEGQVYRLRCILKEKETRISMLNEHLSLQETEISNLKKLLTSRRKKEDLS